MQQHRKSALLFLAPFLTVFAAFIALTAVAASGCDSWYYKTMKKFGVVLPR